MQTSSSELSIHVTGANPCSWICKAGMLVRGLAVGSSCFVVWSGKDARVFRVDFGAMRADPLEPFPTIATAMAIADSKFINEDTLYIAEQGAVKITNFTGTQRGLISFSDAEGTPEHVNLNGRFLAVVTNKGLIKTLDVNKANKPKQIGTAGRFSDPLSEQTLHIRSVSVNCAGNRVAILSDQIEGALKVRYIYEN